MDVYFVSTASTVIAVPTFFGIIAARLPANDLRGGIVKASIQDKEGLTIAGKTSTLDVKESMLRLVLLLSGGLPIFVKTLPGKIIITEFKTLDLSAIIITIIDACLTPSSQKVARSPALTISKMLSSLPSSVPFIFVFTCARALEGSMATSTDNIQRFSFWGCENYVDKICTIVKDIEYEDVLSAHEGAIKEDWDVLKTKEIPDAAEATFELASNGFLYVGAKDKGFGTIEKITIINDKGSKACCMESKFA